MANGNAASLFRNDHGHGVRFLSNPERSAMTQPEAAIERFALADWKNAGGGGDSPIAHDYSPIMERGLGMKNRQDQLDREIRIKGHSCLFVNPDGRVALDRDERAELFVRQLRNGFGKIMHGFAFLTRQGKNRMTAEL